MPLSLSYPLSVSLSVSSHRSFAQFSPLGSIQTLSTVTPKKKILIKIIIIVKNNITHKRNNNNCCFPFLYCLSANEFQTNFFLFYILSARFVYCCCCRRTNVSDRQTERLRKDRGGRGRGADCGEGLLLVADCAVDNAVCSNKSNSFSHSAIFHFTSSIFIFSSSVFNSFFFCCTTKKLSQSEIIFGNCVYAAGATGRGRRGTGGGTEKGRGRWRIAT